MEVKVILLVEDEPDDIRLTQRALEKSDVPHRLVVVHDGIAAMDHLASAASDGDGPAVLPALVLLDLKLPGMDGFEVLQRIRADPRTKRLPVVVLTASVDEEDLQRSYDLGANGYISKPIDFSLLTAAIRSLGTYWLLLNEPPPMR